MSRRSSSRARHLPVPLIVAAMLIAVAAAAWGVALYVERGVLREIDARQGATRDFHVASLEGFLDKYRILPPLIARHPDVVDGFDGNDPLRAARIVDTVAGMTGAEDVRFLTPQGETLAGSGARTGAGGFADIHRAPFFLAALEGRLGRAFLKRPSARHGSYLFAAPVRDGTTVVGVVVVQVSLEAVEQAWVLSKDPVVVTDAGGRIVLTNRARWRGQGLGDIENEGSANRVAAPVVSMETATSDPAAAAAPMPAESPDGFTLVRLREDDGSVKRYLEASAFLPLYGWTLHVYADTALATIEAANAFLVVLLVGIVLVAIVWMLMERRRRFVRQMRLDKANALRLERRVRDRTRDLRAANERLAAEIGEREATEVKLRQAQAELVQAAKLAALGQMSAALSHEFNQPLAAIRSYADNAGLLLDLERTAEVRDNLGRIASLVDRLAGLSKHLKTFARKPGNTTKPVKVSAVLDEALMLLAPKLKRSEVALDVHHEVADVVVQAGQVRLEQVLMNLIANGVDAARGSAGATVRVTVGAEGDEGVIVVSDTGPGIAEDKIDQIFDPFFTTKDVGEGLGLGLSIAYKIVHDFGGALLAENADEGGARFTVRLPLAADLRDAAE
ncbi:MAG: sensor histidine kinase [Hyphomicrobiales bacterium]|nr:MAG: sensor histidine kinase [Hyphomicrobiales bacterium]